MISRSKQNEPLTLSKKEITELDKALKKMLKANPEDERTIFTDHLKMVLSLEDHPLGKEMMTFTKLQTESLRKAKMEFKTSQKTDSPIPSLRHMEAVSTVFNCIQMFREDALMKVLDFYKSFDFVSSLESYCLGAVESTIFSELYTELFDVYKIQYAKEDETHNNKITEFLTITPAHLNVKQTFWLMEPLNSAVPENPNPPYHRAIQLLKRLPSLRTPYQKVNCLIETGKAICSCVVTYWEGKMDKSKLIVGSDELLPLFTYVLIKANMSNVFSEAKFMEDFLGDEYAIKEEGFMLATFQTCLAYVCCMDMNEVTRDAQGLYETITEENATSSSSSSSSTIEAISIQEPVLPIPSNDPTVPAEITDGGYEFPTTTTAVPTTEEELATTASEAEETPSPSSNEPLDPESEERLRISKLLEEQRRLDAESLLSAEPLSL